MPPGEVYLDNEAAINEQFSLFGEVAHGFPQIQIGTPAVQYNAIVSEAEFDEVFAAGGMGERGGFRVLIKIADMATPPVQFSPIIARGNTLYVLSWKKHLLGWEIIAGDPVAEERG